MPTIKPFDFHGQQVRTILIDGEPWFVLNDLCRVLGIANPRDVANRIDSDGVGKTDTIDSMGRTQQSTIVNEPGMYEAVIRSNGEIAKPFRRWITREVLPQIRKTGSYSTVNAHPELVSRVDLARMVLEAEEEKQVIAAALESAAPAIAYHDRFVANDDAVTVKDWAAEFGITEPAARQKLMDAKIIYRKLIGERWSASEHKKVKEFEYRAYASYLPLFDLRPQHNAPRHHNGQVRQTLYIRQEHALQLGARVGLFELTRSLPLEGEAA